MFPYTPVRFSPGANAWRSWRTGAISFAATPMEQHTIEGILPSAVTPNATFALRLLATFDKIEPFGQFA